MIPKKIHYVWLGKQRKSAVIARCMHSWKKVLGGYTIKEWNEHNVPMDHPYLQEAMKQGAYSRAANFIRLHALYEEGGVYLDTDVEVIRPLDPLLKEECFIAFQSEELIDHWLNSAVMGSQPKHPTMKRCLDHLIDTCMKSGTLFPQPLLITQFFQSLGLKEYRQQVIEGVTIFPLEYFYPYSWKEAYDPKCIKDNTYCIHHWEKSWVDASQRTANYWFSLKYFARLFGLCALVVAVAAIFNRIMWVYGIKTWVEGGIILIMFMLTFCHVGVQAYIRNWQKAYRVFFLTLFCALFTAQLINIPYTTWPLTSWRMFSDIKTEKTVKTYQYTGVMRDGREVIILPPRLFPSLAQGRWISKVDQRVTNLLAARRGQKTGPAATVAEQPQIKKYLNRFRSLFIDLTPTPRQQQEREFTRFMTILADQYAKKNNEPFDQLIVKKCDVDLSKKEYNKQCRQVWGMTVK